MTSLKARLGSYAAIRAVYAMVGSLKSQYGSNFLSWILPMARYIKDYHGYLAQGENLSFDASLRRIYPCLTDRTSVTPIEPTYFYQDAWAAGKIFELRPKHHYDVGSSVKTLGIVSQFVQTTMVDIRPVNVQLRNFNFKTGSILALPFENDSIESLSSLCVVEHIGLGRYGDELDPWGSEKAIAELKRVLKKGGNLLVSVPVDSNSRVYFNAHRAFTRGHVLSLFKEMKLAEERYIYGSALHECYDPKKGFGTGLFHFVK